MRDLNENAKGNFSLLHSTLVENGAARGSNARGRSLLIEKRKLLMKMHESTAAAAPRSDSKTDTHKNNLKILKYLNQLEEREP